ncbi:MAG: hypothetical protein WD907_03585 [Bacilli bacterium]
MNNKSPLTAFFLSFLPGVGHLYLDRKFRAFIYGFGVIGLIVLGLMLAILSSDGIPLLFLGFIAFVLHGINILDMLIHLLKTQSVTTSSENNEKPALEGSSKPTSERFYTTILALVPGLGHFQLGLMHRGLSFLVSFFGLFSMIVFVVILSHEMGFMIFLLALPVIWFYNLFDINQLMNRKQRGEELTDHTIFEELDKHREEGKKSKVIGMLLSIFPGAGHMYIGLQRRGLQLMASFLFSIYILDVLHLSLFLFLIPILWFYSFFDSMQQLSRYGKEEIKDEPIVSWLINQQKWIGVGLIALGFFYLFDQAIMPILDRLFNEYQMYYWAKSYLQTAIVAILLIGGGLKLLVGTKRKKGESV